jgi:endonuclease G
MGKVASGVSIPLMLKSLVTILGITLSLEVAAASRNCTSDEKERGDVALKTIQASRELSQELISTHLPLGAHHSTGDALGERLLVQNGYVSTQDDDLRTTLWAAHRLTKSDVDNAKGKDRVNCFRPDPRLNEDVVGVLSDYDEAIYDRGHMTNDADLKDNVIEQVNTYVLSNMSPQHCRFNRGIWLSLEHLTRRWAAKYEEVYVTSGAVFDRDGDLQRDKDADAERMLSRNGKSRVGVPSHYYKLFLRKDPDGWKSIAFLLPHNNDDNGVAWADVLPKANLAIALVEKVESVASIHLIPELDRHFLSQSRGDWDLSENKGNLSGTCE